jgi:hypothetical protein
MGIICFGGTDKKQRREANARKLSLAFLLTYAQRLTAAPIMIRVEEKKENHMVDIK